MFKKFLKNNSGFTLVEIIVVVVVVGILASLAIANYGNVVDRTKLAEAKSILLNGYAGYQRLMFDHETINAGNRLTWKRIGMSDPNTLGSRHFNYAIRPNNINPTSLRATFIKSSSKHVDVALADGTLTYTNF